MNLWIQYLKIKNWRNQNQADQKLNLNRNLGKIQYLEIPDITDYNLEFITEKFKTMDPVWRTEIIKINWFGWNSVHGGYRGRWC